MKQHENDLNDFGLRNGIWKESVMKENYREYPLYAACGLNCGLCPRFHTDGTSRCPGCGGEGFYQKHPSCAIINCGKRHGVDYCFQCGEFPCKRYQKEHEENSFITYRPVFRDFEKARCRGLEAYRAELDEKVEMLRDLLEHYNDGRRKNFYCLAVNLLELQDVRDTVERIRAEMPCEKGDVKERAERAVKLFEETARDREIDLKLKKKK